MLSYKVSGSCYMSESPYKEIVMVIKNKTKFKKEYITGIMRACNYDNNRYKTFKLIYNIFGLLAGMMLVRYAVFALMGSENADTFMLVFYGIVAVIFLYIGMYGMDRSNIKRFNNQYGKMTGITFTYEIDAENIKVTDEDNDTDTFGWNEVTRWQQDNDNIYLFVGKSECLCISKEGFEKDGGTAKDLCEFATAVIGLRES